MRSHLPIHVLHVLAPDVGTLATVHCPRRAESVITADCLRCDRLLSHQLEDQFGGEVVCSVGSASPPMDRRMDFSERAARCEVHAVLNGTARCVRSDARVSDVAILLERDVSALVVVDTDNHPLGLVSRSDIVGAWQDEPIASLTTPCVRVLHERAPMSHAIALLAFGDVEYIPIACEKTGRLVGILTAKDVLRWTAQQIGTTAR